MAGLKEVPVIEAKSRIDFLPEVIRKPIAAAFNACMRPRRFKKKQEAIAVLSGLMRKHGVQPIAIGNGNAAH